MTDSRQEREKVLDSLSEFITSCLESYRNSKKAKDEPTDFDFGENEATELAALLSGDIERFVRRQLTEGKGLLKHCDILLYIGCAPWVIDICGRNVSMHLSHLILEALPRDGVPPVLRAAHDYLRTQVVPRIGDGILIVPQCYERLDCRAINQEETVGLAPVWCDLPTDVRVLIWLFSFQQLIAREDWHEDLFDNFVKAMSPCNVLAAEFPPEAEAFRVVLAEEFGSIGRDVEWSQLLLRFLQNDEFDSLCMKNNQNEFDLLNFCLISRILLKSRVGGVGAFLNSPEEFYKLDDDVQLRLIELVSWIF
ncbi:MAG: hypothetical protein MHM6MM_001221 [Cercozoa sp. M6MM]